MVGQVDPKQLEITIDGVDQARFAGELIHQTDATVVGCQCALGQLIVNVRRSHHGAIAFGKVVPIEAI